MTFTGHNVSKIHVCLHYTVMQHWRIRAVFPLHASHRAPVEKVPD